MYGFCWLGTHVSGSLFWLGLDVAIISSSPRRPKQKGGGPQTPSLIFIRLGQSAGSRKIRSRPFPTAFSSVFARREVYAPASEAFSYTERRRHRRMPPSWFRMCHATQWTGAAGAFSAPWRQPGRRPGRRRTGAELPAGESWQAETGSSRP